MPTKIRASNTYTDIMVQQEKQPWWEKYEKKEIPPLSVSVDDLKFLKEFGDINISIAGMWAMSKLLKK